MPLASAGAASSASPATWSMGGRGARLESGALARNRSSCHRAPDAAAEPLRTCARCVGQRRRHTSTTSTTPLGRRGRSNRCQGIAALPSANHHTRYTPCRSTNWRPSLRRDRPLLGRTSKNRPPPFSTARPAQRRPAHRAQAHRTPLLRQANARNLSSGGSKLDGRRSPCVTQTDGFPSPVPRINVLDARTNQVQTSAHFPARGGRGRENTRRAQSHGGRHKNVLPLWEKVHFSHSGQSAPALSQYCPSKFI